MPPSTSSPFAATTTPESPSQPRSLSRPPSIPAAWSICVKASSSAGSLRSRVVHSLSVSPTSLPATSAIVDGGANAATPFVRFSSGPGRPSTWGVTPSSFSASPSTRTRATAHSGMSPRSALPAGDADCSAAPTSDEASMSDLTLTNMNPRSSPGIDVCAATTASLFVTALEPVVSMAALTDATSPAIATLPSTIAKAAWVGSLAASNTVSSVPL